MPCGSDHELIVQTINILGKGGQGSSGWGRAPNGTSSGGAGRSEEQAYRAIDRPGPPADAGVVRELIGRERVLWPDHAGAPGIARRTTGGIPDLRGKAAAQVDPRLRDGPPVTGAHAGRGAAGAGIERLDLCALDRVRNKQNGPKRHPRAVRPMEQHADPARGAESRALGERHEGEVRPPSPFGVQGEARGRGDPSRDLPEDPDRVAVHGITPHPGLGRGSKPRPEAPPPVPDDDDPACPRANGIESPRGGNDGVVVASGERSGQVEAGGVERLPDPCGDHPLSTQSPTETPARRMNASAGSLPASARTRPTRSAPPRSASTSAPSTDATVPGATFGGGSSRAS